MKDMATNKQRITPGLLVCSKCASVMITRKLAAKTSSGTVKFKQINQCVVCRHYVEI
jgi:hypothetical protein